jgi:ABC-type multidrug transport system ATPase subunit
MLITLTNVGKRYNREWIFRHLSLQLQSGRQYAIIGANGTGKSTLLQVIAGATTCSEGQIAFENPAGTTITDAYQYRHLAIAAPYMELIEEMTAAELLDFHGRLKSLAATPLQILQAVQLQQALHKQIRYYSSGMKQRLKLALAFFSDAPLLILDEPTSNLDSDGIAVYQQLLQAHTQNRLVLIGSNEPAEYRQAHQIIPIEDYKPVFEQQ